MSQWTDRHGAAHTIELDLVVAKRLRRETSLDLLSCLREPGQIEPQITQLGDDDELLLQVLAVASDVTDGEEFARLFDGEAFESATKAMIEAIVDFFREPQRSILRKLLARMESQMDTINEATTTAAMEAIDDLDLSLLLKQSPTPGSGSSESSGFSTMTAAG